MIKNQEGAVNAPVRFTKNQLMKARANRKYTDVLKVVLSEGQSYTKQESEQLLQTFLKGKVN